jgi:hypothetical protein
MKTPKNPMPPALVVTPIPLSLVTPREIEFLVALRAMDDSRQRDMATVMKTLARQFPRRTVPALKLVMGGTK